MDGYLVCKAVIDGIFSCVRRSTIKSFNTTMLHAMARAVING